MALISGRTLVTSLSLFHITLAWFLLSSPLTIADNAFIYVIGEAMNMPFEHAFDEPSPALAMLAVLFFIIGVGDLVAISQTDEIAQLHWGSQAPIRLTLAGGLATYSYFASEASPLYTRASTSSSSSTSAAYRPATWGGEGLKNRFCFTFAFVEMLVWFWAWTTLRDERRDLAMRLARRRAQDEEDEMLAR